MWFRQRRREVLQRSLSFERLGSREVLSAVPLSAALDAPEGEGETHFVEQQGERVFIIGTEVDNEIQLQLGTNTHFLTVDGTDYQFAADEVSEFLTAGAGGNDELQVIGSELDDRVLIEGPEAELHSSSYKVLMESFEMIRLFGANGDDRVQITDSPGNDKLYMHSTFTTFVAGAEATMKVSGFERVEAFASAGYDRVSFFDSPADDRFHAKDGFSFMVGDTFWNYAKGFDRVDAFHRTGGSDEAILRDSDGSDHLTATPEQVVFLVGDAVHVTHDFPVTRAFASLGNDTARIYGQSGIDEIFVAQPNSAFLRTPDVAVNFAVGFDRVEAFAQDPGDRAELKGSSGDDQYVALPEIAELRGAGFQFEVNNFALVRAFGQGGNDMAHLQDSAGDDRFDAKDKFRILSGDGYVNYVEGFVVDVIGSTGDDFAMLTEYGEDDFLIFDDNAYLIWGPDRNERVIDFSRSTGVADGAVLQAINPLTVQFTLGGSHDSSRFPSQEQLDAILARLSMPEGRYAVTDDGNIDFDSLA